MVESVVPFDHGQTCSPAQNNEKKPTRQATKRYGHEKHRNGTDTGARSNGRGHMVKLVVPRAGPARVQHREDAHLPDVHLRAGARPRRRRAPASSAEARPSHVLSESWLFCVGQSCLVRVMSCPSHVLSESRLERESERGREEGREGGREGGREEGEKREGGRGVSDRRGLLLPIRVTGRGGGGGGRTVQP